MIVQATRTRAAALLLVGVCLAQQEPVTASFHAQTDLVTVPFQVRRGSHSVSDLRPADVMLLEDGIPRAFTIFEAPPTHLTLDLAVMFDVTNPVVTPQRPDGVGRAGFWDTKALLDLEGYWTEALARRLLDEHGATVRFSIYRLDQSRLQRLCEPTSDPRVLAGALHRLAGAGPAGQAGGQSVDVPLPPGLALRDLERQAQADGRPPQPSSLAAAISVLKDSAAGPAAGEEKADAGKAITARALVIFSTGAEGTSVAPGDLAEQAIAAGVPVYPVALPGFPWVLPYEGYTYRTPVNFGFYYFYRSLREDQETATRLLMLGPGGAQYAKNAASGCSSCGVPYFGTYYNYPFELLGDVTGGLRFDAVNHFVTPGNDTPPGLVLFLSHTGYSMTGAETHDVLERVKKHALTRFSTLYTVGFVASQSGARRPHNLEVKLASKSSGKLTEGKRSAIY
jgi:hypothetical protein